MTFARQQYYAFQDGKQEGIAEGELNAKIESAANFLRENIAPEVVARCCTLSLEQVQKLAEKLKVEN